jgi:hypothetical protein
VEKSLAEAGIRWSSRNTSGSSKPCELQFAGKLQIAGASLSCPHNFFNAKRQHFAHAKEVRRQNFAPAAVAKNAIEIGDHY